MADNFYEEYSIRRILNTQIETMFKNLEITDSTEKLMHIEKVCQRVLDSANESELEKLQGIIEAYIEDKREELLQDGTEQAG
jgi:hypothetical protein